MKTQKPNKMSDTDPTKHQEQDTERGHTNKKEE